MEPLPTRESRAFRNGVLAGFAVLSGAVAGTWSDHASAPMTCDASAHDQVVVARLFERLTTESNAPLSRVGQRVTRAVLARVLGQGCD